MSTIAVNAITDANAGNTTSINGVTPNANNVVGKNLIINGAMQIAQRGTSATGVTAYGYHTVDRFTQHFVNCGTWTISQDTDSPDGFSNSLKLDCTTADASPASSDRVGIQQRIEGQTLQQLAKGTTSAKSVTMSFWIKSNKTGDIQVNLYDLDNTRQIGNTVTINSAATWEKKSLTFAGDTTGAFDNDNNLSLIIEWWLDSGTDYSSGAVPTSWETVNNADRGAGVTLALADSTSNYINITGVQLEVGDAATEFEHRPYTTELQLCQRYYQTLIDGFGAGTTFAGRGDGGSGTAAFFTVPLSVGMRASPTVTTTTLYYFDHDSHTTSTSATTVGGFDYRNSFIALYNNGFSGTGNNRIAAVGPATNDPIKLNAEL
jgi:hypothetical protein